MNFKLCAFALLAVLLPSSANAQELGLDFLSPSIGFLKPNKTYHLQFPTESHPFIYKESGITQATSKSADGKIVDSKPTRWTMQVRLDMFKVIQHGGGPWVLVEHPASSTDYSSWHGKQRAQFQLSQPSSEKLDNERIAKLKESATREISLTRTWLNTDHAITIKPVTAKSLGIAEE